MYSGDIISDEVNCCCLKRRANNATSIFLCVESLFCGMSVNEHVNRSCLGWFLH